MGVDAARIRVGRQATARRRSCLDTPLLEALAGLHRVVPQEGLLDVLHRAPKGSFQTIVPLADQIEGGGDNKCGSSGFLDGQLGDKCLTRSSG